MTSPALAISGFAVSGPGPADQIGSVTAAVNCWTSDPGTGPLEYELHDGITGALIGAATGTASTSAAHYDTVVFAPPAWAQLPWLQLRVFADQGSAPPGTVVSVDYAALSVSYAPSGLPFAAPVTVPAAAFAAAPAPAVLIIPHVTASAGLAAAAATAPDATGPAGRVFVDIEISVGPTVSRAQAAVAAVTSGNGTAAGVVRGDGNGAAPAVSRAQAAVAAVTQDDGTEAGLVIANRRT